MLNRRYGELLSLYLKALRTGEVNGSGFLGMNGDLNICFDILNREESLKLNYLNRRENPIFIDAVSISKSKLYRVLS